MALKQDGKNSDIALLERMETGELLSLTFDLFYIYSELLFQSLYQWHVRPWLT